MIDDYNLIEYDEREEESRYSFENRNMIINTGKSFSRIMDRLYYLKVLKLKSIIFKSTSI